MTEHKHPIASREPRKDGPTPGPMVTCTHDAEFWITVLWGWACEDAQRMHRLEDRVRYLELPWWRRRAWRKSWPR